MPNIGSSFLLLAVALVLLWLAVTDKLSNLIDAWDVATGKLQATGTGPDGNRLASAAGVAAGATRTTLSLPALPQIGATMANVGIA